MVTPPTLRLTAREKARLRELVGRLRPEEEALAARLLDAYRAEIPQYAHVEDPLVLSDMRAVSLAGLRAWFDWLDLDRSVDGDFLSPVLEAIRRRAVQGVGMDAMMRAYRIAVRVVWQEILALPIEQELVGPLSTTMLEFTDRLTTAAERAYAHEALRVEREPEPGASALFEAALSGQTPERIQPGDFLAAPHCVVVVEVPATGGPGAEPPGGAELAGSVAGALSGASVGAVLPVRAANQALSLEDYAAALVREARAACWTTRVRSIVAACPVDASAGVAGGRDALLRRLARFTHARPPLNVAVGGVADGRTEIRDSFREALEALRVGTRLPGTPGRVHDYLALVPLAVLVADPERARRFVRGTLHQPLGRLADRAWALPTLSAYLRCQGRLKEVAAELAVHPNTVRYRLNELRGYLDAHAADGDQAAALLLAVHVSELLAPDTAES
jgi:hypothetical protein